MPLTEPTRLVLRKELPADADADAYIAAVESADGQSLEPGVKFAIKNFVLCCKQDGIWDAIKASCILAGARTLAGALVPLVGTAPTNNNFVAGDYNRKTGLVGNGGNKYLNSNRANAADPQDNHHLAVYVSTVPNSGSSLISGDFSVNRRGIEQFSLSDVRVYSGGSPLTAVPTSPSVGLYGFSRSAAANFSAKTPRIAVTSYSVTSAVLGAGDIYVFTRFFSGAPNASTNSRLAFYSIGESLDLALLDARVTDLINAFGAAIP